MAWLSGWNNRKSITLSRASGAVTNYQMKLLVGESSGATGEDVDCGALCQTDFDDLRFTTSDGATLLDYWIESITGATPNQLATVWIEFDSIGTGATTFYMYYGNSGAAAYSNGGNTFLFFDDFLTLDTTTKWTDLGGTAVATTDGALTVMQIAAANADYDTLVSQSSWGVGNAVRCKVKTDHYNAAYGELITFSVAGGNGMHLNASNEALGANATVNIYNGSHHYTALGANWSAGSYYILDFLHIATQNNIVISNGVQVVADTTNAVGVTAKTISFYASQVNSKVRADWVLVRQCLATEPAWGSWGSLENINPLTKSYLIHRGRDRFRRTGYSLG